MQNLLFKFKLQLSGKPTYSQMTDVNTARELYRNLKSEGYVPMSYKASAHRLVLKDWGYFTFSPKSNGVHVLAKKFVKED
jgi:hypothetical protein